MNSVSSTLVYLNKKEVERESVCISEGQRETEKEREVLFTFGGMKSHLSVVICCLELDFRLAFLTVEPNREQETWAVVPGMSSDDICARPAA